MNKERELRIAGCAVTLQEILEEEQEYFDAMPESLQGSERGTRAEEWIGVLEDAISSLEGL